MDNRNFFFSAYDVEHMGVKCTGARWNFDCENIFRFEKDGEEFIFAQQKDIESNSDTDHIKKVIEYQFLLWWANKKIEDLNRGNDALSRELERALNYIKMLRRFGTDVED